MSEPARARSAEPGYANGGNKFDLTKWDAAYFKRLKDFMTEASNRGIVVELNFFTPFYEENIWALSPVNAKNNINAVGDVARTNVYTLDRNGGVLAVHAIGASPSVAAVPVEPALTAVSPALSSSPRNP